MVSMRELLNLFEDEEQYIEWGFDLTSIPASKWLELLKMFNIDPSPSNENEVWVWSGDNITLFTANDPISGKYSRSGQREDEKDYASYIGIDGKESAVKSAVEYIKQNATSIKDESKYNREFI